MAKKKVGLSTKQREERLIELVKDAKELGFSVHLIEDYTGQLTKIQQEHRADKEKMKLMMIERRAN